MGESCNHKHGDCCDHQGHKHGESCGHTAIEYEGKTCYLHNGHLHYLCGDHYHSTVIEFSAENSDGCNPVCDCKQGGHIHGPGCGHEAIPHGDHIDYLVDGRLHYQHGDHCDDHGPVKVISK